MIVEDRILRILGDEGKQAIRKFKQAGLKTEPAFGVLLRTEKDPYIILLEIYDWKLVELIEYLNGYVNYGRLI